MTDQLYDLLIVGGGVNGVGIARDAAGRGLKVLLCEKADLGGATSSASSKLVHGGLRYLEHYEFRLVREALREREVLLRAAPHIIWPMRFVLPHAPHLRPAWMIRAGLFLYDHLGGRRTLPGSRGLDLRAAPQGRPLKPAFARGFEYSDCWVEDSRLVVLNAMDAAARGATVLTRTAARRARRVDGDWELELARAGDVRTVRGRALVNAAGPWVTDVLATVGGQNRRIGLRLVKGSHVVVRRLYDGPHAYILQNADRRIVFVIPYERDFTLIGTTDVPYVGDPAAVAISAAEMDYLLGVVSDHFRRPLSAADVVWSFSGVRPLYDDRAVDASAVTRDYVFDIAGGSDGEAHMLSVFGGKITTYRRLAEHALDRLLPLLGVAARPWTARAALPAPSAAVAVSFSPVVRASAAPAASASAVS
ncbi:MAG: glycerol-3-phosphate dehydrogenase, partial [Alphaproteobacteria bacterium]